MKQMLVWIGALIVGAILGLLQNSGIDNTANFIAAIYVRLFQLLAVPTIVLAVTTTLATLGSGPDAGRIFRHTIMYTLLTTFVAALVGLLLYVIIAPGNMVISAAETGSQLSADTPQLSYTDHLLSVIPNNIVKPFLDGNVLSLLLLAAAVGIALSQMTDTPHKKSVVNFLLGIQEVLFMLIRGLIWTLPIGILAFAAQLSSQLSAGVIADSLGKYVAVVLGGNLLQFFVVLPVFLLLRGLNPIRVMTKMTPAIMMALFTKSSAATLPVTMQTAEERLGVKSQISRFVLPICTTINMNGCAAFILVTSLFVMQQGGIELTWTTMLTWVLISVVSAIGNAGVPMGCYFLTLSLMSGINAPIAVLGIILPIYTIIDMVETAVNVWSDSCVCAMTDHDLTDRT
ncbi:MAG: dicarboxylate/amino acid:cation symporter [Prevotella sp.]|nr:dicarboxylate/amino acid:cation symporter [Prevotella sp.]